MPDRLKDDVLRIGEEMILLRRDFHRQPELGMKELQTARRIAERLDALGLEVATSVGKTGVVGLLEGDLAGRTLLLRADMDALPIQEETDLPFRSRNPGVMHACGHDGHMAILLGVANLLCARRRELRGAVKFVFQPGEEGFAGARLMIEDGVLEDPKVDAAFGLHLSTYLPLGSAAARPGPMMASMDAFSLNIQGKGGHAASPHDGADAILMSAQVVSAIQSLISKEVPPTAPLVVHIGTIRGGNAFNIIAEAVQMEGTVRAHDEQLRRSMPDRLDRICRGVTSALRGLHEMDYRFGYPALVNDEAMTRFFKEVAAKRLGGERVTDLPPVMASDDMAFFLEKVPGCYFFVGAADHEKGLCQPNHTSRFDFDEQALLVGAEVMAALSLAYLQSS